MKPRQIITYQNKKFALFKEKSGGKNKSAVDGFYREVEEKENGLFKFVENGEECFLKQPKDFIELFTEGFTGRVLKKMIAEGFISSEEGKGLICADYIKLPNGTYALIQPCLKNFTELFKKIGTGDKNNKDRDPVEEVRHGREKYKKIMEIDNWLEGFSNVLGPSLYFCNYSFHSGNILVVEEGEETLIAEIDWGAALRDVGNINQRIKKPTEYQSPLRQLMPTSMPSYVPSFLASNLARFIDEHIDTLNYKSFTKNYIRFYDDLPGLFDLIAKKADILLKKLSFEKFEQLLSAVVSEMPVDMLTHEQRRIIAGYIAIPSFTDALDENTKKKFAQDMANIVYRRIKDTSTMQLQPDMQPQKSEKEELDEVKEKDEAEKIIADEDYAEHLLRSEIYKEAVLEEAQVLQQDHALIVPQYQYRYRLQVGKEGSDTHADGSTILKITDPSSIQNIALRSYALDHFFMPGQGRIKQVKKDFIDRCFTIQGEAKLGLSQQQLIEVEDPTKTESIITEQLGRLLGKDNVQPFIAAVGQSAPGFIPFIVSCAYKLPADSNISNNIVITQPTSSATVDVQRAADGSIYLVCSMDELPILDLDTNQKNGSFTGPIKASFKLEKQNEVWGFKLETVETNNNDLGNILSAHEIQQDYIKNNYCKTYLERLIENKYTPDQLALLTTKERRTPSDMAAISIGRFFEPPLSESHILTSVVKSHHLKNTQNISDAIVFYTFQKNPEEYIHAFYPTCDSDTSYCDTISLGHALDTYKKVAVQDGKKHQLVIPLATTQYGRKHWLDLFIEIEKDGKVRAKLTDSQWFGRVYPTKYIAEAVAAAFKGATFEEPEYLTQQSLLNFVDCGDFFIENSNYDLGFATERTAHIGDDILIRNAEIRNKYKQPTKMINDKKQKIDESQIDDDYQLIDENPLVDENQRVMIPTAPGQVFELTHLEKWPEAPVLDMTQFYPVEEEVPADEASLSGSSLNGSFAMINDTKATSDTATVVDSLASSRIDKPNSLESSFVMVQKTYEPESQDQWAWTMAQEEKRRQDDLRLKELQEREEKEEAKLIKAKEALAETVKRQIALLEEQKRLLAMKAKLDQEEQQRQQDEMLRAERQRLAKENIQERISSIQNEARARQVVNAVWEQQEQLMHLDKVEDLTDQPPQKINIEEESPKEEPQSSTPPPSAVPSSFFSRHKGKLGGLAGGLLGMLVGAVPLILMLTGIILLPSTFGGSAVLIGLGAAFMVGCAFAGGKLGAHLALGHHHTRQATSKGSYDGGSWRHFKEGPLQEQESIKSESKRSIFVSQKQNTQFNLYRPKGSDDESKFSSKLSIHPNTHKTGVKK